MAKTALGKGLGALLSTKSSAVISPLPDSSVGERVLKIPLSQISPSPFQPRKDFREGELDDLVESIRTQGIIQPLILRRSKAGHGFELIAGERRWRAATQLGLVEAPAIVREASDREVLELALIENLQRSDLNPIEEAEAYARLSKEFSLTQEEIASRVGRSRASVANSMRLLDLDEQIRAFVAQERLSVGHAKVLLGLKNKEEQRLLGDIALRRGSTVRDLERIVRAHIEKFASSSVYGHRQGRSSAALSSAAEQALREIESRLRERFGTKVTLSQGGKKGRIEIEFYGNDDLDRILELLGLPPSAM